MNLKQFRKDNKLTQRERAKKLDIHRWTYSQIETGKRKINNRTIKKILKLQTIEYFKCLFMYLPLFIGLYLLTFILF